jgi:hypothetical protein
MDFSESNQIGERLMRATKRLHDMAPMVGACRQIREFNSDQRKNLLAKYMVKHMFGNSATKAEYLARADENYQYELAALEKIRLEAEQTMSKWEAEFASYEAARSLLSFSKATMEIL